MVVSLCLLDQTLVVVLTFVLASTDAPFDNKARTTFVCPRIAAVCKHMAPDWKYTMVLHNSELSLQKILVKSIGIQNQE